MKLLKLHGIKHVTCSSTPIAIALERLVIMSGTKTYMIVILIQLIYTGMFVILKAAFNGGLSPSVFVFYRQAAATILLLPIAIALERRSVQLLSFLALLKMFIIAFLGITLSMNFYNLSLTYTSATVASATTNSIPVTTFVLAALFRMETIKLKSLSGMAKVLGVALCSTGIVVTALYRGPQFNLLNHRHHHHHLSRGGNYEDQVHSKETWIIGISLMVTANILWSLWLVLQGSLLKECPSKLLFTTLQCLFSTVQSLFVALAFERDISRWKAGFDTRLLAVSYCGFIVTGVCFYLQTWCIEKRGVVFLAMWNPLAFVLTIACSSLILGEPITLGSLFGGLLMVGGLYSVLSGKRMETVITKSTIEDGEQCDTNGKEISCSVSQVSNF